MSLYDFAEELGRDGKFANGNVAAATAAPTEEALQAACGSLFAALPLVAAVEGGDLVCVHGGPPRNVAVDLDDIDALDRAVLPSVVAAAAGGSAEGRIVEVGG